ncbi:hypothetical protein CSV77_16395 [Sporosarcina sp. P16b]|uniref:hypothetical protein n=1 Tax=Sporosarcina sp. P16b TaxID=2048261 RepID=UPI000C163E16|nr:hypothetical protein [Sporosarcina sp. P16b]PIC68940.1 hypothetical protein CSV77_16395 [Sporosarcina sp. P16b]
MEERGYYREKLRILLIFYFLSDEIEGTSKLYPEYLKVFKSEVKIQKIDFLIRYPDYLAYELLNLVGEKGYCKDQIQRHVKSIFNSNEPELRREDMLRYFFGAYEEIDHIILFLVTVGFVKFESRRSVTGKVFDKLYFLSGFGINKVEKEILPNIQQAKWYEERLLLIKKYFGNLSGTELKIKQYEYDQYRTTPINQYIKGIQQEVKEKYFQLFEEEL